jgi:hypothetical protein
LNCEGEQFSHPSGSYRTLFETVSLYLLISVVGRTGRHVLTGGLNSLIY